VLTGCGGGGDGRVVAAPQAGAPACGTALAAAPATVLGRPRAPLPVPGTAAWGEPAVVVRCGLPEQPPTTKRCVTVDDVDWIVDDSGDPIVFTAYGRAPTVEVRVPASYGAQNAPAALVALAPVARALPRTAHACVG
jgi:Protein of unknown function (DUF3515)